MNRDMIARLAVSPEFAELKKYFVAQSEDDIQKLARKSFANPAEHDVIEWERKRAFYAGVDAVLDLPTKFSKKPDAPAA